MLDNINIRLYPLYVFWVIWISQIILYIYNPYNFYTIHEQTWILIFLSVITLSVGYITNISVNANINFYPSYSFFSELNISLTKKILIVTFLTSTIAITITLLFLLDRVGGLHQLLKDPFGFRSMVVNLNKMSILEWDIRLSLLSYCVELNLVSIVCSGLLYIYNKSKQKWIIFLPILNALFYSIITLQRFFFIKNMIIWIFIIITSLIFYNADDKKEKIKKTITFFVGILVIIISILFIIIFLRIDFGGEKIDYSLTLRYAISSIYLYFSADIVALDRFLLKFDDNFLLGVSALRSLTKWLVRFGIYDESFARTVYEKFVKINSTRSMNTYTYIKLFYEDFGIYGMLALNYFVGILSSKAFDTMYQKCNFVSLFIAASIFFMLFFSFFDFYFINITMFFYGIFLFYLLHVYFKYKNV